MISHKLSALVVLDRNNKIVKDKMLLDTFDYSFLVENDYVQAKYFLTASDYLVYLSNKNIPYKELNAVMDDMRLFFEEYDNHIIFGSSQLLEKLSYLVSELLVIRLDVVDEQAVDMPLVLDLNRPYIQEQWIYQELETGEKPSFPYALEKYTCYISI